MLTEDLRTKFVNDERARARNKRRVLGIDAKAVVAQMETKRDGEEIEATLKGGRDYEAISAHIEKVWPHRVYQMTEVDEVTHNLLNIGWDYAIYSELSEVMRLTVDQDDYAMKISKTRTSK